SRRGLLRNFGLKLGKVSPLQFEARIRDLVEAHPTLQAVAGALLAARATLRRELCGFDKQQPALARNDERTRRLMSTPGVGPLVALSLVSAVDDPARFASSNTVGAYFGLTPSRYQSGETDRSGRISRSTIPRR